jgi:hypothetical protein
MMWWLPGRAFKEHGADNTAGLSREKFRELMVTIDTNDCATQAPVIKGCS